ncbi:hypothetical protein BD289DRAFT_456949 [Coniella lustricola]|uniref:sn-1-specific diacylglycerol lipase n=1 Tax=Coniella lustricola TaxID=2025994 RepID=A0A2T2ZTV6_9PEZI|nr:hypothetical protein BD289DRAFT_456949 [Coniella lustricola]
MRRTGVPCESTTRPLGAGHVPGPPTAPFVAGKETFLASFTCSMPSTLANVDPGSAEDHVEDKTGGLVHSSAGRTLLPSPVASAISLWTRSASLALRVSTVIGGYGLGAAKATTLTSLELGRGILEGILHRAGNETFIRSSSDLDRADAETVMERSLEGLHLAMSQVVFWTAAGFHLTGTTLSTISDISQLVLSYLDSILGSTESSRAIASIITLIRREFNNPATGLPGEKVGVFDLIVGIVGMAYFQRWAWRLLEEENRRLQIEEMLWDVVILDEVDTLDYNRIANGRRNNRGGSNKDFIKAIQQHGVQDTNDDEGLPEVRLKNQIMEALPAGAKVAITTETKTSKIITVDVSGTAPSTLPLPPGVELVEEKALRPSSSQQDQRWSISSEHMLQDQDESQPTYRVVFRLSKNELRSTQLTGLPNPDDIPRLVEQPDSPRGEISAEELASSDDEENETKPIPPPKSPPSARAPALAVARTRTPSSSFQDQDRLISTEAISNPAIHPSANQKRTRMPASRRASSSSSSELPRKKQQQPMQSMAKLLGKKSQKNDQSSSSQSTPKIPSEKKSVLRNVLKKGTGSSSSSTVEKVSTATQPTVSSKTRSSSKASSGSSKTSHSIPSSGPTEQLLRVPSRGTSLVPNRKPSAPSPHPGPRKPLTTRALAEYTGSLQAGPARSSYVAVREHRRNSVVSDTYSTHSLESTRPVSPTMSRNYGNINTQSKRDLKQPPSSPSPSQHHQQQRVVPRRYTPSIYTLRTSDSQTSLVPYFEPGPFATADALMTLRRTGTVEPMFPCFHLVRNITRYMRYSSASYGSHFLKMLGISKTMPPMLKALDSTHHEVRYFAHHTQTSPQSVLLASFVDTQGGSDSTGSTETGVPLVHYISLDDESKAVVLACRGTLGFEDVLADMTCDYDDLTWRGKTFKVHKGVHASARRLLYGRDGRVLATIKAALEENPDYGLVLTGHSLGGAVTALLGVMLSEPVLGGTSFITSAGLHTRLLPAATPSSSTTSSTFSPTGVSLPPGRPIHVYAYGPPSTMSPSLRRATRGLITSVVHGQDLVPYLSLGVLHDFQAVALAFKTDNAEAKQEIKQRVWEALQGGLMNKFSGGGSSGSGTSSNNNHAGTRPRGSCGAAAAEKGQNIDRSPLRDSDGANGLGHGGGATEEDEEWAFAAFKTLRVSMMSEKLLPPGEVFVVETQKVLRRDAFVDHGRGRESDDDGNDDIEDSDNVSDEDGEVDDEVDNNHSRGRRDASKNSKSFKDKDKGKKNADAKNPRRRTEKGNNAANNSRNNKNYQYVGRPARRIVLKYVRDVETRFREVRFGATMLTDHSPAKYEDALDGLRFGVVEEEGS